jgi:hypothetical protein
MNKNWKIAFSIIITILVGTIILVVFGFVNNSSSLKNMGISSISTALLTLFYLCFVYYRIYYNTYEINTQPVI